MLVTQFRSGGQQGDYSVVRWWGCAGGLGRLGGGGDGGGGEWELMCLLEVASSCLAMFVQVWLCWHSSHNRGLPPKNRGACLRGSGFLHMVVH